MIEKKTTLQDKRNLIINVRIAHKNRILYFFLFLKTIQSFD